MKNKICKMGKVLFTNLTSHCCHSEAVKLIYTYRYVSLLITSGFYLFSGSLSVVPYKLAAVISLYIAARIITDMYVKFSTHDSALKLLILGETIIITLLLIPTGGLESPFIWYALNPVLVAAWYLSAYFSWFNLALYLVSAVWISDGLFRKGRPIELLVGNFHLILVFILMTLLVRLLATLLKRLHIANAKQRETLKDLMSLYHLTEAFTNQDDPDIFFQTFTNYLAKLTNTSFSFFWFAGNDNKLGETYTHPLIIPDSKTHLLTVIKQQIMKLNNETKTIDFTLANSTLHAVIVRSSTKLYGVLGVEVDHQYQETKTYLDKQLSFLADISSIILERFALEATNDKLILLEERNRIANEIHDSVSQRLFSITCGLHSLKVNWQEFTEVERNSQFNLLSRSANVAVKELRQSIYGLSSRKTGERPFFASVKSYLANLATLNNVQVEANLTGEEELISAKLKTCLYRIICEATGNAVKHGKCDFISLQLEIGSFGVVLTVEDNGQGFEPNKLSMENAGLGLMNMKNLVASFGGKFALNSKPFAGTRIQIEIRNELLSLKEGGIA